MDCRFLISCGHASRWPDYIASINGLPYGPFSSIPYPFKRPRAHWGGTAESGFSQTSHAWHSPAPLGKRGWRYLTFIATTLLSLTVQTPFTPSLHVRADTSIRCWTSIPKRGYKWLDHGLYCVQQFAMTCFSSSSFYRYNQIWNKLDVSCMHPEVVQKLF